MTPAARGDALLLHCACAIETLTTTPFACDLAALSAAQRTAHARTVGSLFAAFEAVLPIEGGYAFTIAATTELLAYAAEFVALERLCCPFFDFAIELPAGSPTFRLSVTGPEGVEPFIREELGSGLPAGLGF